MSVTSLLGPSHARKRVLNIFLTCRSEESLHFQLSSANRKVLRSVTVQEVYGKLEEPDGLAGLAKLRSRGMKLSDQVLAAEKAGSWSEALGLHEQVWAMP